MGSAVTDGEKSEWLSHVHVAPADGSSAFALTSGDKSSTDPAWSPDGKWIAFLSGRGPKDKDGKDPKANVWRIRVDGGEAEALTDEKGGVRAVRWSPDGKTIAFLMTDPKTEDEEKADKEKRDARVVDGAPKLTRLYVVPVEKDADGKRPVRKLTEGAMSLGNLAGPSEFAWSPDGRRIVFSHQPTPNIDDWPLADLSIVEVETARVRALAASGAAESDPIFSPDGRQVAFDQSNDPPTWRRRSRVAIVPVEGGSAAPAGRDARRAARPRSAGRRTAASCSARRTARSTASACCRWRRRPDVREPGRGDGRRTVAERGGHARRVQHAGAGPRARALLGAARALRARAGGEGADAARVRLRPDGDAPLEVHRRHRGRGARDVSRRLRGRHAACRCS